MPQKPNHALVLSRYPRAGTTKTRLIPQLGPAGAADLQRRLVELLLARLKPDSASDYTLTLVYADANEDEMHRWLGTELEYLPQATGNLGQRMASAMNQAFQAGTERVVLVGSDIPGLQTAHLQQAFYFLHDHPVVLGPTTDGGYYLVGCRQAEANDLLSVLFSHIPWSSPQVLDVTLDKLLKAGYQPRLLEMLKDLDTPADLEHFKRLGLL